MSRAKTITMVPSSPGQPGDKALDHVVFDKEDIVLGPRDSGRVTHPQPLPQIERTLVVDPPASDELQVQLQVLAILRVGDASRIHWTVLLCVFLVLGVEAAVDLLTSPH